MEKQQNNLATVHFKPLELTEKDFSDMKISTEKFSELNSDEQLVIADEIVEQRIEIERVELISKTK